MAEKIIMPKAGMAMERGTIIRWLKEVGEKVSFGEPLLEIETDKTTMQVEAMADGWLLAKLYDSGDEVPVVTTIGFLGEQNEEAPRQESPAPQLTICEAPPHAEKTGRQRIEAAGSRIPATPKARRLAKERKIPLSELYNGQPVRARDVEAATSRPASQIRVTPLARRLAEIRGISLDGITGSGYNGKIFSHDLPFPQGPTVIPFRGMRRTIARRMSESHQQIPPVTLNTKADVTFLAEFRSRLNQNGRGKVSYNDLVVAATARALGEFPEINVSFEDDGIVQHTQINIGIAVAVDNGLLVPVIHDADACSLFNLAAEAKALAAAAREGTLRPDQYSGGTFTVTNLGMFGITSFTPIINLPEAAILGVCAIEDCVALKDGQVTSIKQMGLSLTFDHRLTDGAQAARFLGRIRELLENPIEVLI